MKTIKISVELDEKQAWYLAQFVKRVSFTTCEHHSDPTNKDEPYYMIEGLDKVRAALGEAGYSPR